MGIRWGKKLVWFGPTWTIRGFQCDSAIPESAFPNPVAFAETLMTAGPGGPEGLFGWCGWGQGEGLAPGFRPTSGEPVTTSVTYYDQVTGTCRSSFGRADRATYYTGVNAYFMCLFIHIWYKSLPGVFRKRGSPGFVDLRDALSLYGSRGNASEEQTDEIDKFFNRL
ncbi:hypothetical protein L218DRAFT_949686 [Marasmius fiardii PR-910]|nr:hypothetical protein L218DRAFT_949686 [Marasmius fiardii PR-910]